MRTFRSRVMKMAHELLKLGWTLSEALKRAWEMYRMRKMMKNSPIKFLYKKVDGSLREAAGTLMDVMNTVKGTGKECFKTFKYYDIDCEAWRSFRIENFVKTV